MTRKIVLIAGGAGCLGRAVADELATTYRIVVIDANEAAIERARNDWTDRQDIELHRADITVPSELQPIANELERSGGQLEVIVNCVGISPKNEGRRKSIEEISIEEWTQVLNVNLTGMFNVCKCFVPLMKTHRYGRIINVSSQAGRTQSPTAGLHYSSSKAGVLGLTRALATELAPFNILVNAIAPGKIANEDWAENEEALNNYINLVPLRRLAEAREVAQLVAFLASDRSSYITGATIDINGGKHMI